MRILFIAGLALLALAAAKPPKAPKPVKLAKGPGVELVQAKCSVCHPLTLVIAKPKTQVQWDASLEQMISRGAKLSDVEFDQVSAYLAKYYGAKR